MIKTDREMVKWLQIDYHYMTAESCDEDGSVQVHHIPWESDGMFVYTVVSSQSYHVCYHT